MSEIDRENARFENAIDAIKSSLGLTPAVLQIPIGSETKFILKSLTKVDFGERLRVDIKSSIDNGDWVSPKLRNMAGY